MSDKTPLGQLLDDYCQRHGLNQRELAELLEVSQPHVSMVSTGVLGVGVKFRDKLLTKLKLTPAERKLVKEETWKTYTLFEVQPEYPDLKVLIGYLIENRDKVDAVGLLKKAMKK